MDPKYCDPNTGQHRGHQVVEEFVKEPKIVEIGDDFMSLESTKCETQKQKFVDLIQFKAINNMVEDLSNEDEDVESIVDPLSQHQVEDIEGLFKNLNSKNVGNICHECQSTLKVQSHCKFCRVNICKDCVEFHVSNSDKVHEIVSIDEVCPSANVTKCKTHNQICTFECKECHKSMCSSCIRSCPHREHQVEEVADIFKDLSTYIVETVPPSETTDDLDKMITCSKHITSKKLRDVFNSFQVGFPDDPLNESFVHKILNVDFLRGLKVEINSLATGLVLIKNINREHLVKPGEVCVFELDVINEGDQLIVIQKVHVQCYNYQTSNHLHFCCFH